MQPTAAWHGYAEEKSQRARLSFDKAQKATWRPIGGQGVVYVKRASEGTSAGGQHRILL
jgi:hypothetical protein